MFEIPTFTHTRPAGRQRAIDLRLFALPIACALALGACSKPKPPDPEKPPEPQATAATPAPAQATELREAIQQPIDQAKAASEATDAAAKRQREAIDAATGG